VASLDEQVKSLNDQRLRTWERGKEILDRALAEGRTLNQEETNNYNQINDDISRIDNTRDALVSSERAAKEYQQVNDEMLRVATPIEREDHTRRSEDVEASFFRRSGPGNLVLDLKPAVDAHNYIVRHGLTGRELRAVIATDTGASGGSLTVPTTVAQSVYAYMTAAVAMRRIGCTILTTDAGNPMSIPRVGTHGIATQIANQDTAIAGTDPVLANMTLNAFDYGELVAVSQDMIQDSGVDVVDFVTKNIGRAVGQLTATAYVTGTGSGEPNGIQGAVVGAGTISSGGSLFGLPAGRELEKLIDLQYSIADSYRQNGAAWLMRDLTGAAVRKIRDGAGGTAGAFVWQPSPTVGAIGGQPDTFLGDPVYFDPNVASMASNAKIVFYGDWDAYYIRDVRGFELERSDHFLFSKRQTAFRGVLRTDGDLLDTNAINCLKQSV
jgi:HK97 family phage major capsid protein